MLCRELISVNSGRGTNGLGSSGMHISWKVLVAAASIVVGFVTASYAQTSDRSRLILQESGLNSAPTAHRDVLNRPCLSFEAASRRQTINPNIFDHIVSVSNRCRKSIKLRVCYFKSDRCVDMEVAGQQRKDIVLGIFPNLQYFRYSYREKF